MMANCGREGYVEEVVLDFVKERKIIEDTPVLQRTRLELCIHLVCELCDWTGGAVVQPTRIGLHFGGLLQFCQCFGATIYKLL